MSKSSRKKKAKSAPSQTAGRERVQETSENARAVREAIESIVIAFVLAFLFRTFEAEAFVIPTGSMSHTLRGAHKDVDCIQCGFRYQASASDEAKQWTSGWRRRLREIETALATAKLAYETATPGRQRNRAEDELYQIEEEWVRHRQYDTVSTTCPMCRYTMSVDPAPGEDLADDPEAQSGAEQLTYNGDRILVSKFEYQFHDPDRWEVVVFKFPGDAKMNYIKRLVGLPSETVRIQNGDIYTFRDGEDPAIARKPPAKVRAIMQLVHDNHFQPQALSDAGWPERWQVWPSGAAVQSRGWQAKLSDTTQSDGARNRWQGFSIDGESDITDWIRYQHFVPGWDDWQEVSKRRLSPNQIGQIRPQLITDFYSYNTYVERGTANGPNDYRRAAKDLGLHWVGDLLLDCQVEVKSSQGELLLEVVEAGRHFTATIDVATGKATLSIDAVDSYAPTAATSLRGPGRYRVELANVDDQLLLWIDGSLIEFDTETAYDGQSVFGDPARIQPRSTAEDRGDLAPAGIGSRGASLSIFQLRLSRDIYYIAHRYDGRQHWVVTDYDRAGEPFRSIRPEDFPQFLSDPSLWSAFAHRSRQDFKLGPDQFFVLGDNSPSSADGRLWERKTGREHYYVPRELLIGKAVFIYWPHSWGQIPLAPRWVPGWPNFGDMGLVR